MRMVTTCLASLPGLWEALGEFALGSVTNSAGYVLAACGFQQGLCTPRALLVSSGREQLAP